MSGKTVVGQGDELPARDDADDAPTLAALVDDALRGAVPEAIVYRENDGTLEQPRDEWQRFSSVAELPEQPLDGWDELYVYTESFVYRWVGVGFNAGPERLPRSPDVLPEA
ncbi:hypothetical protein ACFR9U_11120 [Halorientalis brevis]|uniref:Halobacterial output domain-containing protein n=1 Tax=Halorientalis brevis TaxID=1126241 RepID=A0ABD6CB20_9EURY|nr:hypothetical protein [Halorientalis brevis]